MKITVAILTISDRSFQGERADLSGPALADLIAQQGWVIANREIVPDELPVIKGKLVEWADSGQVDLVLTTGGTGFSPRDITPEATQMVISRSAPGIAEAMRASSLQLTPHAMLSRAVAGIRARTIIINLPGSPKAACENLMVALPVIAHAVQLLTEDPDSEAGHQLQSPF
jgi:molybdenum cofactor synthesis domain-containing protein